VELSAGEEDEDSKGDADDCGSETNSLEICSDESYDDRSKRRTQKKAAHRDKRRDDNVAVLADIKASDDFMECRKGRPGRSASGGSSTLSERRLAAKLEELGR
jgi:hypothetical protein